MSIRHSCEPWLHNVCNPQTFHSISKITCNLDQIWESLTFSVLEQATFCMLCSLSLLQRVKSFSYPLHRSASKATGHSFYYLKGAAALLELAMVQYAVQKLAAKVCSQYMSVHACVHACTCACVCICHNASLITVGISSCCPSRCSP